MCWIKLEYKNKADFLHVRTIAWLFVLMISAKCFLFIV